MASNDRANDTFNTFNNSSTARRAVDAESRYAIHRRAARGFGVGVDVYGRVLPIRDNEERPIDPDDAPIAAMFDDPERF